MTHNNIQLCSTKYWHKMKIIHVKLICNFFITNLRPVSIYTYTHTRTLHIFIRTHFWNTNANTIYFDVLCFAKLVLICSLYCIHNALNMVCINIVNSALMHAWSVHLNTYIHTYVNSHLRVSYLKGACTLLHKCLVFVPLRA